MTRLQADALLLITAIIWGTAFLFQKTAMNDMGPFSFVAVRFALSALVIAPFAYREARRNKIGPGGKWMKWTCLSGLVFVVGTTSQQLGIARTSVTNAGFLTCLYAIITPFLAWLFFRHRPRLAVWVGATLSILGVWLLENASLSSLHAGDALVIGCAFFYALHTILIGFAMKMNPRPLLFATIQYALCAAGSFAIGLATEETVAFSQLAAALPSILYAGFLSGGVAYTFQFIAQQHAPPSDAAILLSSESLFAALAGTVFMGDRLSAMNWVGCAAIMAAILMIEAAPLLTKKRG